MQILAIMRCVEYSIREWVVLEFEETTRFSYLSMVLMYSTRRGTFEDYHDLLRLIQSWTLKSEGKAKACVCSRA
ncbi:hypothetical protein F5Y05DRAFT_391641 [Hypoxylon sp. FL0543]|nr:hypothetical protein F5Y05DRAFT_391641 [Hypoxylon sp. FL0543]